MSQQVAFCIRRFSCIFLDIFKQKKKKILCDAPHCFQFFIFQSTTTCLLVPLHHERPLGLSFLCQMLFRLSHPLNFFMSFLIGFPPASLCIFFFSFPQILSLITEYHPLLILQICILPWIWCAQCGDQENYFISSFLVCAYIISFLNSESIKSVHSWFPSNCKYYMM